MSRQRWSASRTRIRKLTILQHYRSLQMMPSWLMSLPASHCYVCVLTIPALHLALTVLTWNANLPCSVHSSCEISIRMRCFRRQIFCVQIQLPRSILMQGHLGSVGQTSKDFAAKISFFSINAYFVQILVKKCWIFPFCQPNIRTFSPNLFVI